MLARLKSKSDDWADWAAIIIAAPALLIVAVAFLPLVVILKVLEILQGLLKGNKA